MASFQTIVVVIAILLLIVCLVFIGITLVKTKNDAAGQWPPIVGECPDYWVDTSGNGSNCVNVRNLGTCTSGGNGVSPAGKQHIAMNFTVAPYVGGGGTCAKYTWANSCGVTWDGITTGIANPCATEAKQ
jgi:hypothetical protein